MTNAEMGNYIDTMSTLKETGKLGYAIARNLRILKTEATEYLQLRAELFQKYGAVNGDTVSVTGENIKKFQAELGDIPMIEHDVDVFKVSEEVFTAGNLTATQMEMLLWMVEENNG